MLAPAVLVAFVASSIAGLFAADAIGLWEDPLAGFAAASTVVFVAFAMVPERKLAVATFILFWGAAMAWLLLDPPSSYPESYRNRAYAPTYIPILSTYAGGVLAWVACAIYERRRSADA